MLFQKGHNTILHIQEFRLSQPMAYYKTRPDILPFEG